ncbi:MAG: electron transfer flavoprotein subunit alpha/FixB family protein [candidate division WOR-3 bacterium]|nr:electron transfer flavoprotein subunit alpha/FixB family protein [candidate division WOR-3 bacterium]MCX7837536.1 electron transfer flavoprotein subunit alpha/FixB family protein [candidate division WOR-3 bacterium]MDW8113970.1 electron transfer flavoprotein subunit alpha/FixB family protein [candidate division WOR-3 bacterium]
MKEIIVFIEHRFSEILNNSYDALAFAYKWQSLRGGEISCLILTSEEKREIFNNLKDLANKIYLIKNKLLENYHPELYLKVIKDFLKEKENYLFVLGQTSNAYELASSLAIELSTPVITDINGIEKVNNEINFIRYFYGGKICGKINILDFNKKPFIVTIQSGSFKFEKRDIKSEIIEREANIDIEKNIEILGYEKEETGEIDITKSEIVIGIGRGLRDKKNLPMVEELAKKLKGVLAGSRPAIDAGWLTKDRQVGSSGKTIKPKLYLALGISGAFQHIVGIKNSDLIIAINKDPNAPIFSVSHYGIVEDLTKVVPALLKKL